METRLELLQVESEFQPLLDVYKERKPLRVLEIGCWDGGTLREWLTWADPEGTVVAIDLEHRNESLYSDWIVGGTTLITHTGSSHLPAAVRTVARHGPYDWVFIDGDHSDDGVRADIALTIGLISKGGLLILHDITAGTDGPSPPGVVFNEFKEKGYKTWEYVDPTPTPWSKGIGVVEV